MEHTPAEPRDVRNGASHLYMKYRIHKILLVCCSYDGYILEEDGHIESRIKEEYLDLNLSNPPAFTRVSSTAEALDLLERDDSFDFVLTMYNVGTPDVFAFGKLVKAMRPALPIALLTSFSQDIYRRLEEQDRSGIDDIFCWHGNTDLIIALIKLVEDRMNADDDILLGGVQSILLVEDSIRFYSTYLPELYRLILLQNTEFLKDAYNEGQLIQRKRSRPKILLATNFEDAQALYNRYRDNLLGVISDVGFVLHRDDPPALEKSDAGIDLCRMIRQDNPLMPVLLQSSQTDFRPIAEELGAGFIAKNSKTLLSQMSDYLAREFAFGDFLFRDLATGQVIGRAKDLRQMQELLASIPDDVLEFNTGQNNLSKWLYSRGLFPLAASIRRLDASHFRSTAEHREALTGLIRDYRNLLGQGVIARFDPETYSDSIAFARMGEGSIGGKARGLAFMNSMLIKYRFYDRHPEVRITIPRSVVIATDYFDAFIRDNGLEYIIAQEFSDEEILAEFVGARLPEPLYDQLRAYIRTVRAPLAVRSSSKLEDSHYQPFAGIYSTYMIPHTDNEDQMLRLLVKAIKCVYASVYYAASRAYIQSSQNLLSEEKMAVILQEVCGSEQDGLYLPTLSGVARSINYYPIGDERPEEGICQIAMGLGKLIVEGGRVLRFSPVYPRRALQTSTPRLALSETQTEVLALDLRPEAFRTSPDDEVNIRVGPRQRPAGRQPRHAGRRGAHLQSDPQIRPVPPGRNRARHAAGRHRRNALPRGDRIRRQYGRDAGTAADFQPVANPPHRGARRKRLDRLEDDPAGRCPDLCRKRSGNRGDGRHQGYRLCALGRFRRPRDRGDRRRAARAQRPHAGAGAPLRARRTRPLGFLGPPPGHPGQVDAHLRGPRDRRVRHPGV